MPLTTCIIEYVRKDMKGKVLQKIFPALGTVNTITLYDSFAPEIAEQVKNVFWICTGIFRFLNKEAIFSE